MTTPTPIPDFCVSSQADGFDEFLRVFNEHLRDIVGFADNKRTGYYYGYENGSPISIQEAWIPLILTHQAIALLTAKPLTEGLVRGNNFECIESFLSFRDEVMYKKGKEYKCDGDKIQLLADVRGWGAIQNLPQFKKDKDDKNAMLFQDALGQFIVDAINEKLKTTTP